MANKKAKLFIKADKDGIVARAGDTVSIGDDYKFTVKEDATDTLAFGKLLVEDAAKSNITIELNEKDGKVELTISPPADEDKTVANVMRKGFTERQYSLAVHGKDFKSLAEQFASRRPDLRVELK